MSLSTTPAEQKTSLWDPRYVIENLPTWIYTDNEQPNSLSECKAKISSLKYTMDDINLQIEIRDLELRTGNSRHQTSFEYEKWKTQALRAKQTHMYLLNAYTYWLLLNERNESDDKLAYKIDTLIHLLIEDPIDFIPRLEQLL